MTIRDRWNRVFRRSISSTTSSGNRSDDGQVDMLFNTNTTATVCSSSTPSSSPSSTKTGGSSSRFSRIASWRHSTNSTFYSFAPSSSDGTPMTRSSSPPPPLPPMPRRRAIRHPSERPLTEQNLRHQEQLGKFTMKFGRSRTGSVGRRSSFSGTGISPCQSRRGSVDS